MPDARDEPRFEDALARLEELVRALEGGTLSLEDSLARFEEGVALVRLCARRLAAAKLRLRELDESPDGPRERDLREDEA
jgi:exodeoxyribonuclease VII small subunit